jgi:hypothetical protein
MELGAGFDVLGQEFAENDLFGEVLRADHGAVWAWGRAGCEQRTGDECQKK